MKKRRTLYEISTIGLWKRVAAIDVATTEEVIVQVSKKTSKSIALNIAYKALQKKMFPEDPEKEDKKIPPNDGGIDISV